MLLFLPGLICDERVFAPQLAAFPGSRAVASYGLADTIAEMAGIALAQAPDRFDLFGHSMGGRIALEVYRQAPQRVRRLALCSTGIHPLGDGEPAKRRALQQIGYDGGFEALVDAWLPPMVAERNRGSAAYAEMRRMSLEAGQERFDAQIAALLGRPEVATLLPQIACPTLVMTGALDTWSPPAQHEAIAAAIPDSQLVIVPGAGHMVLREAPAEVNQAIARWLQMPARDPNPPNPLGEATHD